jgi:hypothetical protein
MDSSDREGTGGGLFLKRGTKYTLFCDIMQRRVIIIY